MMFAFLEKVGEKPSDDEQDHLEKEFSFLRSFHIVFNRLLRMHTLSRGDISLVRQPVEKTTTNSIKLTLEAIAAARDRFAEKGRDIFVKNFFRNRVGWMGNKEEKLGPENGEGLDSLLSRSEHGSYWFLTKISANYTALFKERRNRAVARPEDSINLYPKSIQVAWQICSMIEEFILDPERDNLGRVWREGSEVSDLADFENRGDNKVVPIRVTKKRNKNGDLEEVLSKDGKKIEKLEKEIKIIVWYKNTPISLEINLENPPNPEQIAAKLSFIDSGALLEKFKPVPKLVRTFLRKFAFLSDRMGAEENNEEIRKLFKKIFGDEPGDVRAMFTVLEEDELEGDSLLNFLNRPDSLVITGGNLVPIHQAFVLGRAEGVIKYVASKFSHPYIYGLPAQQLLARVGAVVQHFVNNNILPRKRFNLGSIKQVFFENKLERSFWKGVLSYFKEKEHFLSIPNDFFGELVIGRAVYGLMKNKIGNFREKTGTIVSFSDIVSIAHMLSAGVWSNHNCVSTKDQHLSISLGLLQNRDKNNEFQEAVDNFCIYFLNKNLVIHTEIKEWININLDVAKKLKTFLTEGIIPLMREDLNAAAERSQEENDRAIVPTMAMVSGDLEEYLSAVAEFLNKSLRDYVKFPGGMTSLLLFSDKRPIGNAVKMARETLQNLWKAGRVKDYMDLGSKTAIYFNGFGTANATSYQPPEISALEEQDRFAGVLGGSSVEDEFGDKEAKLVLRMTPEQLITAIWSKFVEKYKITEKKKLFKKFLKIMDRLLSRPIDPEQNFSQVSSFKHELFPEISSFINLLNGDGIILKDFFEDINKFSKEIIDERMNRISLILRLIVELLVYDFSPGY